MAHLALSTHGRNYLFKPFGVIQLSGFHGKMMARRWTAKSSTSGYFVALTATLVIVLFRILLSSILADNAFFFPFVIAVTLSAWFGGLRPGLVSTVLGAAFGLFFFVPPQYSFKIPDSRIATTLVFFVVANVTISLVCGALHKALRTVEQNLRDIERRDQALRDADRRKDTFLAVLAHELRNPLAPLRNSLEILKRSDNDSALNLKARATMERQLSHMVRLVDDLLDLSRINSDKLQLQKQPVALSEVVSQAVETVRPLIAAAGHELTVDLPEEPMWLSADTVRLSQAFSNLLNNACKYTDPGGHISLSAVCEDGTVVVAVRDNGMGVPEELSPKIFDMFTQANQSSERHHGGLGIGLALVKRLVEMHEGEVSVRANPEGQGSEFRVRLPLVVAANYGAVPQTSTVASITSDALRILVVDDNHDAAESLALLLELAGHRISLAHDGEEALQKAFDVRPDVVLLDVGLPKLNGYEVARRIRLKPWGTSPIIVAITGWGQTEDIELAREAGFDHHLVKPVEPDAVLKLVEKRKPAHA